MEAIYLEYPDVDEGEAGWYVCTLGGEILEGPFPTKNAADEALTLRFAPKPPGI